MNSPGDNPFGSPQQPPQMPHGQAPAPQDRHPAPQPQPPGPPDQTPVQPESAPGSGQAVRNAAIAIGSIVLASVLGAIATALITPETFRGGSSNSAQVATSPEPTPPGLITKRHPDGGLTVDVPQDWPVGRARYNPLLKPGTERGTSMDLGPGMGQAVPGVTRITVAAGRGLVAEVGVTTENRQEVLRDTLASWDWTIDGCVLRQDEVFRNVQMEGQLRHWTGCHGLAESHLWEVMALTNDGHAVMVAQMQHRDDLTPELAARILDSVRVRPSQLQS